MNVLNVRFLILIAFILCTLVGLFDIIPPSTDTSALTATATAMPTLGKTAVWDDTGHITILEAEARYPLPQELVVSRIMQWSLDCRFLAFRASKGTTTGQDDALYRFDTHTRQVRYLTASAQGAEIHAIAWSPDGKHLAFGRQGDATGEPDLGLWVVDVDGTALSRLPGRAENHGAITDLTVIAWSPDGKHIAYSTYSGRDNQYNDRYTIYIARADGSGEYQLTGGDSAAWLPDSQALVVSDWRSGAERLYLINVDGTGERPIARGSGPAVAPDGSAITFTDFANDFNHLNYCYLSKTGFRCGTLIGPQYALNINGAERGTRPPAWSSNGKWIGFYVVAEGDDSMIYYVADFDPNNPRPRPLRVDTQSLACPNLP